MTPVEGYQHLIAVRRFELGPVGASASTSMGEFAFRAALRSRNPPQVFKLVLSQGTEEGKLYALCGIRATDRAEFDSCAAPVVATNAVVATLSGCIGSHESATEVVKRIAAGVYDSYFSE